MGSAKIAGVLLVAGRGTRFGGDKLEAMLGDKMLGAHAAQTLARAGCAHLIAVHDPAHVRLASALKEEGYSLIDNDDPAAGQAHSLILAVQRAMASDADAILVCLGDMPFVGATHIAGLCAASCAHPGCIVASTAGTTASPPAIFPRSTWPHLLSLRGDAGARSLLKEAIHVAATAHELTDIDSQIALSAQQPAHIGPD